MSTQVMEQPKGESPKLPDMIMCGDHPSVTKTELNAREPRADKARPKALSHSRITPSSSRTERPPPGSELALRCAEGAGRADALPAANKALVYVALGSFRWPPYLLCVWVLVLLLTHALHALVAVLDAALPPLRKVCVYFRAWTEEAWRGAGAGACAGAGAGAAAGAGAERETRARAAPLALGAATALLYAAYGALFAAHALALWAAEPLAAEPDDRPSLADFSKVTNYSEDGGSKTNLTLKH